MEREIFLTGIGGQGVQLAAKILALAATREGRGVMSLGTYGGTMRGGNTDSTVVVADGPIHSPPIVARGWSAIVVHPRFFGPVRPRVRAGGVVVFDTSLVEAGAGAAKGFGAGAAKGSGAGAAKGFDPGAGKGYGVDANALSREAEAGRAGSLVLLGAYCGLTGMVSLDALNEAMREAVPPYRHQQLPANERALALGHAALPAGGEPAWGLAA